MRLAKRAEGRAPLAAFDFPTTTTSLDSNMLRFNAPRPTLLTSFSAATSCFSATSIEDLRLLLLEGLPSRDPQRELTTVDAPEPTLVEFPDPTLDCIFEDACDPALDLPLVFLLRDFLTYVCHQGRDALSPVSSLLMVNSANFSLRRVDIFSRRLLTIAFSASQRCWSIKA